MQAVTKRPGRPAMNPSCKQPQRADRARMVGPTVTQSQLAEYVRAGAQEARKADPCPCCQRVLPTRTPRKTDRKSVKAMPGNARRKKHLREYHGLRWCAKCAKFLCVNAFQWHACGKGGADGAAPAEPPSPLAVLVEVALGMYRPRGMAGVSAGFVCSEIGAGGPRKRPRPC
jgi:hypothetical protein